MSRALPIVALTALLLVAGCGASDGGGEQTQTAPAATTSAGRDYRVPADRICAEMIAESAQMGREFRQLRDVEGSALNLTTTRLVKPALPILERDAGRLRALARASDNVAFGSYVALFDPIIAVVADRVEAGEAGDSQRAHELELQMIDLSNLQRQLARQAGLETCDVNLIATFATSGHAG